MSDTDRPSQPPHPPSSGLGRWAVAVWASFVFTPAVLWCQGREARLILPAVGAYLAGWIFLLVGLRDDPNLERVSRYARSRSAAALAALTVILLEILAFAVGAAAMLVAGLAVGAVFLGVWALSPTEERLHSRMNNLLVMAAAVLLTAGAGEFLLSLPPVATRFLPPALVRACRETWERANYDRLWEKNVHRFRSFHLDEPKGEGGFRIVTLGDSFTWGDKIGSTRDTWPYVLEKECESRCPGVQVINLARCGFTTANELEMLNRFGWEFRPDLVIVQYFLNDPLPSRPDFQAKGEESMQAPTWRLSPYLHETLDRHSYLYSLLNQRFSGLQRRWRGLRDRTYADLFSDDFSGWRDNRRAFQELARIGRQKVPVLLVLFPSFQSGLDDRSYPYLETHRKILSAAAEAGLPAMDLRPVFARIDPRGLSWWAIPVDTHPGVRAHRVAGESIAQEIQRRGLLPDGKKARAAKSK